MRGTTSRSLRDEFSRAPFDEASLEQHLRQLPEQRGVKAGTLIHATRIAMTGRMVSPGLFEMLVCSGRERVARSAQSFDRVSGMKRREFHQRPGRGRRREHHQVERSQRGGKLHLCTTSSSSAPAPPDASSPID